MIANDKATTNLGTRLLNSSGTLGSLQHGNDLGECLAQLGIGLGHVSICLGHLGVSTNEDRICAGCHLKCRISIKIISLFQIVILNETNINRVTTLK